MTIFNGLEVAARREAALKQKVQDLGDEIPPVVIAAVVFQEDQGSMLYTRLKSDAAKRVGMEYRVAVFSLFDATEVVAGEITRLAEDKSVTGIIIQKPWRKLWQEFTGGDKQGFQEWWQALTEQIPVEKDVDGLSPQLHQLLEKEGWKPGKVLPATCKAVLQCLSWAKNGRDFEEALQGRVGERYVILGKSDLLGNPLYQVLKHWGFEVDVLGSKAVAQLAESGEFLREYDVVVSATGVHHLVKGAWLKPGATIIDVGEPKPDVEFETAHEVAEFITPVPGGVGPLTVISLLENALDLAMVK